MDRQPFDWSLTLWTGPSDLAYAIGLSWAPDVQALLVSDTLNAYYEGLLSHGVSGYRWEDLLSDYRLGLVQAVGVPANWCAVPEARERMRWLWPRQARYLLAAIRGSAAIQRR